MSRPPGGKAEARLRAPPIFNGLRITPLCRRSPPLSRGGFVFPPLSQRERGLGGEVWSGGGVGGEGSACPHPAVGPSSVSHANRRRVAARAFPRRAPPP